jgi:hypothetical protein
MPTKSHLVFDRSLERANTLLDAHKAVTKTKGRPPYFLSDILRASLVFAIGSLDSYFHDVIHENIYALLQKQRGRNLSKKLLEILREAIPYEKALEIFFSNKQPVLISTAIRKRNADRTFMKSNKSEEAFQILGINDIWKEVASKLHQRKDGLKRRFDNYAWRRDKIVHEGDMGKATRTKGKLRSIRRPYVEACLKDVRRLVGLIDNIVLSKTK